MVQAAVRKLAVLPVQRHQEVKIESDGQSSQQSGTVFDTTLLSSDNIGFCPEIICEIISYLHGDKKTLLTLGLVSKQTLYETRHRLFSTLNFSGPPYGSPVWKDFHRFLRLVDVAWTSFTPTIECISIHYLNDRPPDGDGPGRNISMARILTNLRNVKSLRLSNLKAFPSYVLNIVLQFPIEQLSLLWCDASNIPKVFNRLAPSLKTLDITGMNFAKIPDPYISHRVDSRSLFLFKSVWDPSICHNLDIKVKMVRLISSPGYDKSHGSAQLIQVVQKFLYALPSPRLLQETRITVKLVAPSLEEDLTMLELFEWSSLVETIQQLFPSLKKLTIRIGTRSPFQDPNPYLALLRRLAGVQQLEKEGLIELCAV